MKVAFISRATLVSGKGGDSIQVFNTARQLRVLGIDVDIYLSGENIDFARYDLLHFFNIIRPDDILPYISKTSKPFVVSTIFVDYSEYEKTVRKGRLAPVFRLLSTDGIEYVKAIGRLVINGEKIKSPYYLLHGHRRSVKKIIRKASMLLPNSLSEYERFRSAYEIDKKYKIIPNGIDTRIFNPVNNTVERDSRLVLCVARIEGLKNQLNLIRALSNTSYTLILIGARAPNQKAYYDQCMKEAASNIHFIDFIEQEALLNYYQKAKVHVLPSWFETTGLSSLEAAAMGCNIVVTRKGDTSEYFKDYAYYCSPDSVESIYKAVEQAAREDVSRELSSYILSRFTWENAAEKTREAYLEIL